MEKQMTQTWHQFLTVGISDFKPVIIDWNSEGSYKNTSPANALKKHKEMYPSQSIKVVSV
jgi:hypothetical protein